jgi:hypothetical protein
MTTAPSVSAAPSVLAAVSPTSPPVATAIVNEPQLAEREARVAARERQIAEQQRVLQESYSLLRASHEAAHAPAPRAQPLRPVARPPAGAASSAVTIGTTGPVSRPVLSRLPQDTDTLWARLRRGLFGAVKPVFED